MFRKIRVHCNCNWPYWWFKKKIACNVSISKKVLVLPTNGGCTTMQIWVRFIVLYTTFNNIAVISWRSVLLMVKTGVSVASHWQTLMSRGRLGSVSSLLAANLYQGNRDRNHKRRNIVSSERYLFYMQVLLACCYIFFK